MERPSAPGSGGRYVSGDPVHDLASARGHEWLTTYVPVRDVLSQGILSSSTTWHFREFGGSPACYHQLLVIISDPAFKHGQFFLFFYPSTLSSAFQNTGLSSDWL